jgi:hypothetical protein
MTGCVSAIWSATVKPARPAPIMSTGRSAFASEEFGEGFELAIESF